MRMYSSLPGESVLKWVSGKEVPLVFYAGSGKLNPLPFFVLGKMAPGVVGGFISALVHT